MLSFSRKMYPVKHGSAKIKCFALIFLAYSVAAVPDRTLLKSDECNYLELSEGQKYNAIQIQGHPCCLCDAGTKLTGLCNSTNPASTVCDPCAEGEYQDFAAHMETECRLQIKLNCRHPKIFKKGSKIEADRCVCKLGFEENFFGCSAVATLSTNTPMTSVILTKITSNVASSIPTVTPSNPPETTPTTSTAKSTTVVSSTTPVIADSPTTVGVPNNLHNSGETDFPVTALPSGGIAGIVVGIVVLGILATVFVILYRRIQNESVEKEFDSAADENTSSPVNESSQVLVPCRKRTSSLTSPLAFCNAGTNREEVVPSNMAGPEERRVVVVEACDNGADHMPPDPEQQRLLGAVAENAASTIRETERNGPNPEVFLHPVLSPEKMDLFIMNLANEWTSPSGSHTFIGAKNVNPVFRRLFEKNSDAILESANQQHMGNLQEMIYQLLRQLQRNLGRRFTPEYIICKLRDMNPPQSNLINIIEDVVKKLAELPNNQAGNNTA